MSSRAVLDVLENTKASCPYRNSNPGTRVTKSTVFCMSENLTECLEILRTTESVTTFFFQEDQWTIDN